MIKTHFTLYISSPLLLLLDSPPFRSKVDPFSIHQREHSVLYVVVADIEVSKTIDDPFGLLDTVLSHDGLHAVSALHEELVNLLLTHAEEDAVALVAGEVLLLVVLGDDFHVLLKCLWIPLGRHLCHLFD